MLTLLGPRQTGKTILARFLFPEHHYVNLENPQTLSFLREDLKSVLMNGKERLIIDEEQRVPKVLSWVKVFSDPENLPGQLVSLSALSGDVGVSSTTLAGWLSVLEASFVAYRL